MISMAKSNFEKNKFFFAYLHNPVVKLWVQKQRFYGAISSL